MVQTSQKKVKYLHQLVILGIKLLQKECEESIMMNPRKMVRDVELLKTLETRSQYLEDLLAALQNLDLNFYPTPEDYKRCFFKMIKKSGVEESKYPGFSELLKKNLSQSLELCRFYF